MEDMRYKSAYIQCSSCVTFQSLMQPETAASHAALISGIFLHFMPDSLTTQPGHEDSPSPRAT